MGLARSVSYCRICANADIIEKPVMSMSRHTFNTLPPKDEYLLKIRRALKKVVSLTETELVNATGLTKTQTLCALQLLVRDGVIVRDNASKKYSQT